MIDDARIRRPSVLYIGGTGRSGSTLLARMLGQTPGFAAVGELRYVLRRGVLEDHLCGCGEPFRSCPYWKEVFALAFGGMEVDDATRLLRVTDRIDRVRYIPQIMSPTLRSRAFRRRWTQHADLLGDLYAAIAEVADARVVVDSSKDPSYAFMLRSVPTIDLSVVHLTRDSRAVAFSWLRPNVRPEIHWRVEHMRKRPPLRSALLWTEYHLLFELLERVGTRERRLAYEQFVRDPEPVLRDLREWMGGAAAALAIDKPPLVHDISGNPIRFATGPLTVREDDEWKGALSAADRRIVTAVTAPLLARYGYVRWSGAPGRSHTH